jgi:hypothetical protein
MPGKHVIAVVGVLAVATLAGCTHVQLRKNTVRQSETHSEIYEQQVMDNLAKFMYDQGALPHFAIANAGASGVEDFGNINGQINWDRFSHGFASAFLGGSIARRANESWTLVPVSEPRRLELMRCAYQNAVAGCACNGVLDGCPDCNELQNRFYGPEGDGTTHIESASSCWFGYGPKSCVPKDCCAPVGHYCGMHVWVLPGGRNELAKLTLIILDYAMSDLPSTPVKEVTWFLDAKGGLTEAQRATRVIKAVVPFGASHAIPSSESADAKQFGLPILPSGGPAFPSEMSVPPSAGALEFEQLRRALVPFSR